MTLRTSACLTAALATLLLAPSIADAAASKSKRQWSKERPPARLYDDRDRFGWYPRNADQLKIGSRIWFDQMEAEGRFGTSLRGQR
jgi:hypothetical protein